MNYSSHPHHRDERATKSQWRISIDHEEASFDHAHQKQWLKPEVQPTVGWGLYLNAGSPSILGVGVDRTRQLFMAKFVTDNGVDWHGYPADHQANSQDIPLEEVLNSWLELSILSPAKIRKISRGKSCRI